MGHRSAAALVLAAALVAVSCGDEKSPSGPTPSPTPSPAPTPTPSPSATPTPAPSASPTPAPEGTHEPAVFATAGVHSYRRKGQLVREAAPFYLPGDTIYMNCSPRDANGNKTDNHAGIQGWKIFSNELVAGSASVGDFYFTDTNSFNPDVHINARASRAGTINASCKVQGLPQSNTHHMPVKLKK